ncbi:MAG: hypothetical protein ACLQVL_36750 [Terriglobia bacterium]
MELLYALTALLPILAVATWVTERHRRNGRQLSTTEWCARLRALDKGKRIKRPKARHEDCKTGAVGVSVPAPREDHVEKKVSEIRRKAGQ